MITVITDSTPQEQYLIRVEEVVKSALNERDFRKECECFQHFLDVSQRGPNEVRILCERLCSSCLPKILSEMEENLPDAQRFELGMIPTPDQFKSRFLSVPAKTVLFESGDHAFVSEFSISLKEITVGQFSTFCKEVGYATVAEKQKCRTTYRLNYALQDFSAEATLDKPATYLSYVDAQTFCNWAGKRLPTEAEFLAASLIDDEIRTGSDVTTEQKIRTLLAEGRLPSFVGTSITGTIVDDANVVMRSGPIYTREVGWRSQEKYQRHLRAKHYFDASTTFHVCNSVPAAKVGE